MKRIALGVFASLFALMLVGCGENTSTKETTTTVKTTPAEQKTMDQNATPAHESETTTTTEHKAD